MSRRTVPTPPRPKSVTAPDTKVSLAWLHPGHYSACFAESVKDLMFYDAGARKRVMGHGHGTIAKECGSAGIVEGRNKVTKAFLDDTGSDWLFWIDSDMGFAPDSLDRLLAVADPVQAPVVGGLCFAAMTDGKSSFYGMRHRCAPTVYDFHTVEAENKVGFTPRFDYPPDEVVEVAGTGSAFLLIHRSVMEAIRVQCGDNWYTPVTHPMGPSTFSEDLSFCLRVAMVDRPVFVHTGVKTTHDKGFAYLDEEFYIAQEIAAGRRQPEEQPCPQPRIA